MSKFQTAQTAKLFLDGLNMDLYNKTTYKLIE